MRRSPIALASVGVALLLAACTSDRSTAPRQITVRGAASTTVVGGTTLTCDFNTTKADAPDFFASSTDPVFAIIRAISSLYKTGGATAATVRGFDGLQQISQARGTSRQAGSATVGGTLVLDFLACMSVGDVNAPNFSSKIVGALSTGIFKIVSTSSAGQALAEVVTFPGPTKAYASPLWGAEPSVTTNGWATNVGRYLFYGSEISADFGLTPSAGAHPFDLGTVPEGLTYANPLRVGICIDPNVAQGQVNRLVHQTIQGTLVINTILPLQGTSFCHDPPNISPLASLTRNTWFASVARVFTVRDLYAQTFDLLGGVGGLGSEFSPYGPAAITAANVVLAFVQQPSNGFVNTAITPPVTVSATTNGKPMPGIEVTLVIAGNNGQPALISGNVATTQADGVATFSNLQFTKAGGYTIQATGSLNGGATQTATSVLFNIQNK